MSSILGDTPIEQSDNDVETSGHYLYAVGDIGVPAAPTNTNRPCDQNSYVSRAPESGPSSREISTDF